MRSPASLRHKQSSNFDDDEAQSEAKLILDRAIYETGGSGQKRSLNNKTLRNDPNAGLSPDVTFNNSGNKFTLQSWNAVNSTPHKYGVTMVQSQSGSMSTSPHK